MGTEIRQALRPAVVILLPMTALLGILYPLAVLGLGQAIMPHRANGSLVRDGGRVAAARGLAPARVERLIASAIDAPIAGVLGEPRVNVLALNRQLDRLAPNRAGAAATP